MLYPSYDMQNKYNRLKVYVYPTEDTPSDIYLNIINSIKNSQYYTRDPEKACLKILAIDTIDRDIFLQPDFSKIYKRAHFSLSRDGIKNYVVSTGGRNSSVETYSHDQKS